MAEWLRALRCDQNVPGSDPVRGIEISAGLRLPDKSKRYLSETWCPAAPCAA